jgi:hypothetical protein
MAAVMTKSQVRTSSSSTRGEAGPRIIWLACRAPVASAEDPFQVARTNATLPDEDQFVTFAKTLYILCRVGRTREAIAEALDYFDDRLLAGEFRECDRALRQLDVARLAPSVMVSILGITIRAKKLKGRSIFFERSSQAIANQKGKRYASELLTKYR